MDASEWMPIAEVVQLLPSCRPGKRLHLSTVHRWVSQGRLEARRQGRWLFVRREDVMRLMEPVETRPAPQERKQAQNKADRLREQQREWAAKVLRDAGIG